MKPAERELFRLNLLQQLDAVAPRALRQSGLKIGARLGGFEPTDEQLLSEIDYLVGKGLAAPAEKTISPEIPAWKATAAGRDFVGQNPLPA